MDDNTYGLSGKQLRAAWLSAEDALSNERIAEEVGVSRSTLQEWKKMPTFMSAVRDRVQELDESVSQLQFAKRRERIRALEEMAQDYITIRNERAEWFAKHAKRIPGGRTGRIVKQDKVIGTGKSAVKTTEYVVDRQTDEGFKATLKQIAQERGEWSEKRELSGPNGLPLLPIVEVTVVQPDMTPRDDEIEDA